MDFEPLTQAENTPEAEPIDVNSSSDCNEVKSDRQESSEQMSDTNSDPSTGDEETTETDSTETSKMWSDPGNFNFDDSDGICQYSSDASVWDISCFQ